jgi:hypothetical protein
MLNFEHRGKMEELLMNGKCLVGMFALIGQANGKKSRTYISVKAACKLSGWKQQYLRRLLRQEKLSKIRMGQV